MPLNVCEIFYSLQGESTFAGLPCIFIRLAGCNLACTWCDTDYARNESSPMSVDIIVDNIATFDCSLVEITGGEPLLQEQTPLLINRLIKKDYTVLLETNGSRPLKGLPDRCIRIMDIKCPSSGEQDSFLPENIEYLTEKDEVKFVIGSRQDYAFAKQIILKQLNRIKPFRIHLSPVFGDIEPKTIADWMIQDNLPARLSLQQHKFIWDPEQRGV